MSRMVRAAGAAACPFCGSEEVYVEEYEHHPGAMRWRVLCAGCMAGIDTGTRQSAGSAVQDWNRRAERTCRVEVSHGSHGPDPRFEGDVWTVHHVCSECGGAIDRDDTYCKHCGAKVVDDD